MTAMPARARHIDQLRDRGVVSGLNQQIAINTGTQIAVSFDASARANAPHSAAVHHPLRWDSLATSTAARASVVSSTSWMPDAQATASGAAGKVRNSAAPTIAARR